MNLRGSSNSDGSLGNAYRKRSTGKFGTLLSVAAVAP